MTLIHPSLLQYLTIDQVLNRHPLTVPPSMTIYEVVTRLGQLSGPHCQDSQADAGVFTQTSPHRHRYALVVDQGQLLGIFTERDVVRLVVNGVNLEGEAIAQVMSQPIRTLPYAETYTLFLVLSALQEHQVRQLPVLDPNGQLLGVVDQASVLASLDPLVILEKIEQLQQLNQEQALQLSETHQQLKDTHQQLQTSLVEQERLETILLQANQHLEERMGIQAAQLVQIDEKLQSEIQDRHQAQIQLEQFFALTPSLLCIAGLDGYFQRLNSRFTEILGYDTAELMAAPFLHFVHPDDHAATVAEVSRLATGASTIAFLNRYRCKDGTYRWFSWNATAHPKQQVIYAAARDVTEQRRIEETLAQQYQQQQLLAEVTRNIRDSLDLDHILETAATGVQELLVCDRVLIIRIESNTAGQVIQDATNTTYSGPSLLHEVVTDLTLKNPPVPPLSHTRVLDVPITPACSIHAYQWLQEYNMKSCVEVAIYVGEEFWGLITVVQCDRPRQWASFEINLVQQIANQLGIAISQSQLLRDLEQQVDQRTVQLRQTNAQLEQEIQERGNTEIELRENQQRLSGILDNADEAIISIDQNQQIVLYNQGAEKIFGYAADEALGQALDILLPEAFQQIHRHHVQSFATSSEASRQMAERSSKVSGRRKNGEEFPAEASISRLQTKKGYLFTVMLKDITARQQAEDALRRSEEQLRLTTDALPVLICYVDEDQHYTFLNQTYADWFQRPVSELCGQFIGEVIGEEAYKQARSHIEAALSGARVHYEMSRITPDGKARDLDITYIPDVDEDGTVNGFFSLINDISDRKATERLKDEFVSVVGHELRTPLTSIHGSLKLLATKRLGTLAPQGQNIVDIALRNTERLTRLINDVLDLERIQSGRITMDLQDCELSHLMTQAIQSMQSMANEYDVQLLVMPLETSIWADPDHLTQVLTNLLSNAIKFSNSGDTIWVRATVQDHATVISVQDYGRGIPPDKIATIFERFQQVDASDSRQRGGTGLGLTICQQIIQQHNGRIWAESVLGKGSTFFFSIPYRQ